MNDSEKRQLYLDHIYIYKDDVYRIINNVFSDPYLVDELTQTVMINAWKGLESLRDVDRSKAWVKAITRNVIRGYMRSKREELSLEELEESGSTELNEKFYKAEKDVLDVVLANENSEMLGKALRSLDPQYQELIRKKAIGDITLKEIAIESGIKYGRVRATYIKALKALKAAYLDLMKGGGR